MPVYRLAATVAAFMSGMGAGLAFADPVVVELYTSQGCSSCPPADQLLEQLASRKDVLALALHVDTWDYIGWKDTFGSPGFTERQKGYAEAAGHRSIYTPQMVIGGVDHVIGYQPDDLARVIKAHEAQPDRARIALERDGDQLAIGIALERGLSGEFVVQLVRWLPSVQVTIDTGENAGRTIDYANVVTQWTRLADWDGRKPLALNAEVEGKEPVAVILQRKGYGPIIASAALR